MQKRFSLIICSVCLAFVILLGSGFTSANAQTKTSSAKKVTYSWHLVSHSGKGELVKISATALATKPFTDTACLGVALTINPGVNSVQVIMGINNLCGLTVVTISWLYTSTAICAGQAYNGPSNGGNVASLASGTFLTVANDHFISNCIVNGVPIAHTLSFTGTDDGVFAGRKNDFASGRQDVPPVTIP